MHTGDLRTHESLPNTNIYLIGYRATGKSTVAPLVAERLGTPWSAVDMDVEIERRAGRTIAEIFAADGEPAFRDLEEQVLAEIARRSGHVAATGGGVIGRQSNQGRLASGIVVWLTATPETILRRLDADRSTADRRPNLTNQGGLDEIKEVLARREPVYRSLAQLTLDTEALAPAELAERIAELVRVSR